MRLNHRIQILREGMVKDGTGGTKKGWAVAYRTWGRVLGVSGRTYVAAGAEQSQITMQVDIRFRATVVAGMRVTHNGVTLEVVAPLPDDRRQFMKLMCKTVKGG